MPARCTTRGCWLIAMVVITMNLARVEAACDGASTSLGCTACTAGTYGRNCDSNVPPNKWLLSLYQTAGLQVVIIAWVWYIFITIYGYHQATLRQSPAALATEDTVSASGSNVEERQESANSATQEPNDPEKAEEEEEDEELRRINAAAERENRRSAANDSNGQAQEATAEEEEREEDKNGKPESAEPQVQEEKKEEKPLPRPKTPPPKRRTPTPTPTEAEPEASSEPERQKQIRVPEKRSTRRQASEQILPGGKEERERQSEPTCPPPEATTSSRRGVVGNALVVTGGDLSHASVSMHAGAPAAPSLRASSKPAYGSTAAEPKKAYEHAIRRPIPPTQSVPRGEATPAEYTSVAGGGAPRSVSVPGYNDPFQTPMMSARSQSVAPGYPPQGGPAPSPMAMAPYGYPPYPYPFYAIPPPSGAPQDGWQASALTPQATPRGTSTAQSRMGAEQPTFQKDERPQEPVHGEARAVSPRRTPITASPAPSHATKQQEPAPEKLRSPTLADDTPLEEEHLVDDSTRPVATAVSHLSQTKRYTRSPPRRSQSQSTRRSGGPKFAEGDAIRRNHFDADVTVDFGGSVMEVLCGERAVVSSSVTEFVDDPVYGRTEVYRYHVEGGEFAPPIDIEPLFNVDGNVLKARSSSHSLAPQSQSRGVSQASAASYADPVALAPVDDVSSDENDDTPSLLARRVSFKR